MKIKAQLIEVTYDCWLWKKHFSLTTAMDAEKAVLFRVACHEANEVKSANKSFLLTKGMKDVWKIFYLNQKFSH